MATPEPLAGGLITLHEGSCLEVLPTLPDASADAVVTDPPYPEIDRAYGCWTEAEWWDLMTGVCREVRRVLKPTGSAVFILQPNSRKVGSVRGRLSRKRSRPYRQGGCRPARPGGRP